MTAAHAVLRRLCAHLDGLTGTYTLAEEVSKFIATEQGDAETADEIADYATEVLAAHLQTIARNYMHGQRAKARRTALRGRFARYQRQVEDAVAAGGQPPSPNLFEIEFAIEQGDNPRRRRMADMTAVDHKFVASSYEANSKRSKLEAAFHRSVAAKLGDRRTCDVFDLAALEAHYRSFTGKAAAA